MTSTLNPTNEITFRSDMHVALRRHMASDKYVIDAMLASTQDLTAEDFEKFYATKSMKGRINFLMSGRHGSPFEHNMMTFYAEVPLFVAREWHRHRIGVSYNERSGRYSVMPSDYYVPPSGRPLVQVGKPGAYTYTQGTAEQHEWLVREMKFEAQFNYLQYQKRLNMGIAREVARMSLGLNLYTAQVFTCNARSLMAFLSLRQFHEDSTFPSGAMHEINRAADKMEQAFAELMPITHEAFVENGRVAP